MWPELFPFLAIMTGALMAPTILHPLGNYVTKKGHWHSRNQIRNIRDFYGYRRDEYLVGSMYKAQGLEAIPDES